MAFYNRLKTMKSAPVGTIMPWSGSQGFGDNPDNVPTGWILCDGRTYDCALFPLLASILGNTYGPTDDAITGNFPDFDEGGGVPLLRCSSILASKSSFLRSGLAVFCTNAAPINESRQITQCSFCSISSSVASAKRASMFPRIAG